MRRADASIVRADEVVELGACWPDGERRFLLQIAAAPAPLAHHAWRGWCALLGGREPDLWSVRLLPLVAQRLRQLGIAGVDAERLKGVYRHTWCNNQLRLKRVFGAVDALAGAGISVMALKGLSLLPRVYSADLGLRAMLDVDLLVRPSEVQSALRTLVDGGWRPAQPAQLDSFAGGRLPWDAHAIGLLSGTAEIDLHWRFARLDPSAWLEEETWARAERVEVGSTVFDVPGPDEQLLSLCTHGVCWTLGGAALWPVDVLRTMTVLDVDWRRFVALTRARLLTLLVYDALRFVRDVLDGPVPREVMAELAGTPVSALERSEYRAATTPRYCASFADRFAARELIRLRAELGADLRSRVHAPERANSEVRP